MGDIDVDLARNVADKIGSVKVHPVRLDASDRDQVVEAAQGVDVIINLTHLKFNDTIMEAALGAKTHYVDTATTTAFLENWISDSDPEYQQEFIKIGKTALAGCGFEKGPRRRQML